MTTPSLDELFSIVESPEYSNRLNLASGTAQFVRLLEGDETVRRLVERMDSEPAELGVLLKRIVVLAQRPIDPAYEHPADAALASYLWILSLGSPTTARLAAAVVRDMADGWWMRKIALIASKSGAANVYSTAETKVIRRSRQSLASDHVASANVSVMTNPLTARWIGLESSSRVWVDVLSVRSNSASRSLSSHTKLRATAVGSNKLRVA